MYHSYLFYDYKNEEVNMYDDQLKKHQEIINDNLKTAECWNRSSASWYEDIELYVRQIIEKPEFAFPSSIFKFSKRHFLVL